MSQGTVHVGDDSHRLPTVPPADGDHGLRQLPGAVQVLDEGAAAHLHVQHQLVGAGGQFLAHHAAGDQGDAGHGGRHIPQGIDLLIRGSHVGGLAGDGHAHRVHIADELLLAEGHPETGDGLQLVDGAAGVAQTPPGHLGHAAAAGHDDGPDDQGGLVADAAGAVLVHLDALDAGKIDLIAGIRHHGGEVRGLPLGHSVEEDGHDQGRRLVVRQTPFTKLLYEEGQFFPGQLAMLGLSLDDVIDPQRRVPFPCFEFIN